MLFKTKHLFFFHSPKSMPNPKMGETFWPPVKGRNFLPALSLQHGSLEMLNELFLLLCWNSHWSWWYQHPCKTPARSLVVVMQLGERGGKKGKEGKVALPEQWLCLLWSLCSPGSHSSVSLGLAGFHDQGEAFLQAREIPPAVIWAPFKRWWLCQSCPNLSQGVFSRFSQVIVLGDLLSCSVS